MNEAILKNIRPEKLEQLTTELCKILVGNGLSFRQAEVVLEITKDRLKDAKMSV